MRMSYIRKTAIAVIASGNPEADKAEQQVNPCPGLTACITVIYQWVKEKIKVHQEVCE